jgi:hypothetical protein
MKGYWCISYNWGDYQLFITGNKKDYDFVKRNRGYLGDKILAKGGIEIEKSDLTNFTDSKNPKLKILVQAQDEARKTKKFDKKSLENRLKEIK